MKDQMELKNLPDKIWLQVGEVDLVFDNDFKTLREENEITWCEDKIDNWDIGYTRTSLIEGLISAEVESRIKEIMPKKEEEYNKLTQHLDFQDINIKNSQFSSGFRCGYSAGIHWFRSRMKWNK